MPHQVGNLQIFQIDRLVGSEQFQRCLMMKVSPLAFDRLMCPLKVPDGFPMAVAALLALRDTALCFRQLLFTSAMQMRILYDYPISGDEKHL